MIVIIKWDIIVIDVVEGVIILYFTKRKISLYKYLDLTIFSDTNIKPHYNGILFMNVRSLVDIIVPNVLKNFLMDF